MLLRSSRAIHEVALSLSSSVSAFVCRPCGCLAHHSKQPPSSEVRQRSQPGKPLKHVVDASATTLAGPDVCENTASRDAPQRPQSYFFPRSLLVLVPIPHAPADPSPPPLPTYLALPSSLPEQAVLLRGPKPPESLNCTSHLPSPRSIKSEEFALSLHAPASLPRAPCDPPDDNGDIRCVVPLPPIPIPPTFSPR